MVSKIIRYFTREISGLHRAAYVLALFTFLSQLLGLFRDRILAHHFGAGVLLDIYYAAFRIPDLLLVVAASVVSISVLVPLLTEQLEQGKEAGKNFVDAIFTVFFCGITVGALLLFVLAPQVMPLFFPGFADPGELHSLILLTRILLLSPVFLGLSNLFASIVQVHKRFLVYALSPVLYNLGIIFGIVVLFPLWGVAGLGLGVVLGAMLHVGVQLPVVIEQKLLPRLVTNLHGFDVWRVVLSSLPRSLTLSVSQLAFLVLIGIASTLAAGSIAIFNLSFNLQSVPLAIVGVSYSLAAFPALSRMFAAGKKEAFLEEITTAARHIIFWSLPATVLFMVLRAQIVRTVLGTGQFDWVATRLTAAALALFVLSVSAQSLSLLFARGYYAMGHTKKPLLAAITGAIGMSAFAYLLLQAYDHYPVFVYVFEDVFNVMGVPGTRVLMLPLAYSLGIILNALVLWLFFRQEFKGFTHRFGESLWQSLASSIIAGYASYLALDIFDEVFNLKTLPGVFLQGICAGIVGVIVAGLVLCMLDNKEIAEMIGTFRRRFWKKPEVVGPDVEEL